ncbi:MAG: sugar nucleotide-binding protein, partial [Phycisphaerae bacterium]|nr:sugar nucleotide-binding protein [Phycisphaerae bacterium]
ESHRDEAERLNADAAGFVARAAAKADALIVYISTDFVFDGAKNAPYVEDDLPRPASVYGQTKLKGERTVMSATDRHLIVRTAWLYGAGGRNFVDTICDLARSRGEVRVVSDQVGCPTWNHDLAGAIIALLRAQAVGTYHACGRGEATWYDLAVAATGVRKINATVRPVSTREFNRLSTGASGQEARTVPAPRPASSVMSCEKLRHDAAFAFPPWRHSLEAYIAEDTEGEK